MGGQRRSLAELTDRTWLCQGDVAGKHSRFWILLGLAAVIASAGVVTNATAAVIGAMIIAPLGTPILGTAAGIVAGSGRQAVRSLAVTVLGAAFVVALGALIAVILPMTIPLAGNPQVTGRTSPGLVDLLIAVATGVAGALGTARKDVGDVLPGVAIAISLVPPLAVAGVAAQDGQGSLALGALLLFATNLVALVAAGTVVFTAFGYAGEARCAAAGAPGSGRRRGAHVLVALSVLLVAVPLAADTFYEVVLDQQLDHASAAAAAWARSAPGTQFQGVAREGTTYVVAVEGPATGAPPPALLRKLAGVLPPGTPVVIDHVYGRRIDAGTVP
jgi:uncharacterized hydrophobic protein (TIGR00271 family)